MLFTQRAGVLSREVCLGEEHEAFGAGGCKKTSRLRWVNVGFLKDTTDSGAEALMEVAPSSCREAALFSRGVDERRPDDLFALRA